MVAAIRYIDALRFEPTSELALFHIASLPLSISTKQTLVFTSVCNLLENSTKSPQRQNAMQNQEERLQNFFALICKTE